MRKFSLAALAATAAFGAVPAEAATSISFTPNVGDIPTYIGSSLVFNQTFGSGVQAGSSVAYTSSGNETVTGDVRLYSSDVGGQAVGPANKTGNFLSILGGGAYQIAFTSGVSVISFLVGGIDSYNKVTLNFAGGSSQVLDGRAIVGLDPTGAATNSGETGRVTYDFGSGPQLTSILFSSSQAAFEIDDIVAAAPEPATWLMMILGFGLVGGSLRRRRNRGKLVAA